MVGFHLLRSILFVGLISMILAGPTFADGLGGKCASLFSPLMIQELAQLRISILSSSSEAVRRRLEQDFEEKYLEVAALSSDSGASLKQMIRDIVRQVDERRGLEKMDDQKLRTEQRAQVLKSGLRFETQIRTSIEAHLLKNQNSPLNPDSFAYKGTGVSWTSDERFVAFRPADLTQASGLGLTQIYDLQTGQLLPFQPSNGFFSGQGHLWVIQEKTHVQIFDPQTGALKATFPGSVMNYPPRVTENYAITQDGTQVFINYFSGLRHSIGFHHGLDPALDHLAFFEGEDLRLFQLSTGQDLGTPMKVPNVAQRAFYSQRNETLVFDVDGQLKFVYLGEWKIRDLPNNDPRAFVVISGTRWARSYSHPRKMHELVNFDTGRVHRFASDVVSVNQDRVIFRKPTTDRWFAFDLRTEKRRSVVGPYDHVLGGRYLVNSKGDQVFDAKNHRDYWLPGDLKMSPVPGKELLRFNKIGSTTSWVGRLNDFESAAPKLLHDHDVTPGISPKGNYFLSSQNGKIVVLKLAE